MPSVIYFLPLFVLQVLWFIVPGLSMSVWISQRKKVHPVYITLLGALVSCLVGYGAFWLFLANPTLGMVYDWAVAVLGGVSFVFICRRKNSRALLLSFEVLIPITLWVLTALFYTTLMFGCRATPVVTQSNQLCYLHNTTFDNILPQLFANNVYNKQPKALMGDWHGSDRPPLQTGIVLFEAPFTEASPMLANMSYPILSTFLQVLWVPAVWMLGRKYRLKNSQLTILLIFCATSGFFLFNSVFTWPKLLAGSLATLGFSLLILERKTRLQWLLATLAMTAALLAHGGVAFILLPLYLLMLTKRYYPGWKIILESVFVFGLLFGSWSAYQHFYDPPGDRGSQMGNSRSHTS